MRTGTSDMQLTMSKKPVDQKGHTRTHEHTWDVHLGLLCRPHPKRLGTGHLFLGGVLSRVLSSLGFLPGAKIARLCAQPRFFFFWTRSAEVVGVLQSGHTP